jgi:hypothetical protein
MRRRTFLGGALAGTVAGALTGAGTLGAGQLALGQAAAGGREYYELRKYHMVSGGQGKLLNGYLTDALIPALNRMGMAPVGAFNLSIGPETPTAYVLIPSPSVEALVTADLKLAQDDAFLKAAGPFWNAPAAAAPFVRIESTLLVAFEGRPKLKVPPPTATHGKRVFQLRTYESPTNQDHVRKVEMFNSGEFEIFEKAGFWPVFYADALIGPRLPKLTYMLSFPDLNDMNAKWDAFSNDPDWKKLSGSPRYNFESIVSDIDNLILNPMGCSQI